jgi:DNA topoisomerase VI subunit B
VRKALEKSGDVETVTTSVDTKGRKQPAKKTSKLMLAPLEPTKSTTASDLRSNIGPTSQAEAACLRAQVDELQAENRRREIETIGLKGEIEELKAARAPKLLAADRKAPLGCSFCGKAEHEVGHLIVNPFESRAMVSICNECVELCVAIIKDREVAAAKRQHQPKQIETPDIPLRRRDPPTEHESTTNIDNHENKTKGVATGRGARFQQAKKPRKRTQFLQIVAKPNRPPRRKIKHKLTRVVFLVSRLMEFCTKRELQNQTGHSVYDWPLVVLKELMDNALDACEEAEVAPVIEVIVGPASITIADNADGFAAKTIDAILDYSIRASSREAYVSPTRGAQGNALKTILAMGYVLDREHADADAAGVTIIESRGIKHRIEFRVDHINNQPKIAHITTPSARNVGSRITVEWPRSDLLLLGVEQQFKQLTQAYVFFNPHLSLRGVWHDREFVNIAATNPHWEKWRPRNPTSPHWYDESRLQRYLAAHVARDSDRKRQRTVREFIAEFRGLSGTAVQRKILEEIGCSHQSLAQFFGVDRANRDGIAKLLAAMRKHSKPVNPKHLGIIGAEHLKQRFLAAGGNAETFKYEQRKGFTSEGIPYVVEFAFGLHQSALAPSSAVPRTFITGANWSVGIHNPFRAFGSTGEGLENTLAKVRANASAPVISILHLASAYIQYADRGKSSIILTENAVQPDD